MHCTVLPPQVLVQLVTSNQLRFLNKKKKKKKKKKQPSLLRKKSRGSLSQRCTVLPYFFPSHDVSTQHWAAQPPTFQDNNLCEQIQDE